MTQAISDSPLNKSRVLWLTAGAIVVLLLMYWQTAASIVAIWERSETFAHGYVIFPISAFLIWQRRAALLAAEYHSDWRAMLLLAGLGMGWVLAHAGGVQVIEQFALVAAIPMVVWAILGWRAVATILFPLAFLLFAVPFGEFLIMPLMNFTADFVVTALQLTGIPVYREGTFFTIPSGQWSVVEGCSGLRYLIASFTLGTLYAYLTYRSAKRRVIFSLLSILVPIIANGLRAYMIVMIAHLSDMKLALGVDHYIYGWVFFGFVMLLLFWIGAFWREDEPEATAQANAPAPSAAASGLNWSVKGLVLTLAAILPWPMYAQYLDARSAAKVEIVLTRPSPVQGWQQAAAFTDWHPRYAGATLEFQQAYRRDNRVVGVFFAYYRTQQQAAELHNSQNVMTPQKHPVWRKAGESVRSLSLPGQAVEATQTLLRSDAQRLLIWEWNRIGQRHTNNFYLDKVRLALNKVLGMRDDGAAIVVYAPYEDDPQQAAAILESFIADMLPAINASLDQTAQSAKQAAK